MDVWQKRKRQRKIRVEVYAGKAISLCTQIILAPANKLDDTAAPIGVGNDTGMNSGAANVRIPSVGGILRRNIVGRPAHNQGLIKNFLVANSPRVECLIAGAIR